MVVYGSPVPQNWDYGIWTYRVSSQMEEKTGVSVATAVTSADTASTLARLHAEAKQKIFDSISHKAIPGSIKFNLEFENVKEIKSKGDADQFVNSVNTALDSVGAVSAIIPGGQMVALATEIARILGISSFIKSLFGWDDPPTVRAYAVGYTATYKVGFDHVQVVGPGKKDELRARIPIQYVVDGKVYVPYDIKWHQLPYYIAANTGFATYIYDVVEDEETPEYSINVEDMAGIPNISRSENIYYKEVISRDFWTGNTILSDYIPTKGYLFYGLSLYNENVNNLVGALATYFPHYPWDIYLYLLSCIFSCSSRLYSPMPLNTQTLSTGTIYNNIMGNIPLSTMYDNTPPDQRIGPAYEAIRKWNEIMQMPIIKQPLTLELIDTSQVNFRKAYLFKKQPKTVCIIVPDACFTTIEYEPLNDSLLITGKISYKFRYKIYRKTIEVITKIGFKDDMSDGTPGIITAIEEELKNSPYSKPRKVVFYEYTGTQLIPHYYKWENGNLFEVNE